jgi:hypothetical protein
MAFSISFSVKPFFLIFCLIVSKEILVGITLAGIKTIFFYLYFKSL